MTDTHWPVSQVCFQRGVCVGRADTAAGWCGSCCGLWWRRRARSRLPSRLTWNYIYFSLAGFFFFRWIIVFNWMNLTCWSAPGSTDPQHHPEREKNSTLISTGWRNDEVWVFLESLPWQRDPPRLAADTLPLVQFDLFTRRTAPVSAFNRLDNPTADLSKNIFKKFLTWNHFRLWNLPDALDHLDLCASTHWLFLFNLSEAHRPSRKDFLCPPLSSPGAGNERPRLAFCKLWGEPCGTLRPLNSSRARSCPSLQMHSWIRLR